MKEIVEKLRKKEELMSMEKGQFSLFVLVLRDNSPGKWDLVVAAPWMEKNKKVALKYLVEKIKEVLSQEELLVLSRILILDKNTHIVPVNIEHGMVHFKNCIFNGLQISDMYVITSK